MGKVIRPVKLCFFFTLECIGFNNVSARVIRKPADQIMIPGWAISKQSLQVPPPFFLPQATLGLFRSPTFFFALLHLGALTQAISDRLPLQSDR